MLLCWFLAFNHLIINCSPFRFSLLDLRTISGGTLNPTYSILTRLGTASLHYLYCLCLNLIVRVRQTLYKLNCIVFRLAVSLVDVSEHVPEPWVAMGYFSLKSKRFPRAVYFAQKVQTTNRPKTMQYANYCCYCWLSVELVSKDYEPWCLAEVIWSRLSCWSFASTCSLSVKRHLTNNGHVHCPQTNGQTPGIEFGAF